MRVISYNREEKRLRVEPESVEDLWYLTRVISQGDEVSGRSFRRFKSEAEKEGDSGEKKPVFLRIGVEKAELAENAAKLRVTGRILGGTPEEFVQTGSFHTIDFEPHQRVEVIKEFSAYDLSLIEEAKKKARHPKALLVVMDDRKANLAMLRTKGLEFTSELEVRGGKREAREYENSKKGFYEEIAKHIENSEAEKAVIAGVGFTSEEFRKYLKEKHPETFKKCLFDSVSNAERTGITELLKKGALERLIGEQKLAQEFELLEKLKESLGKEDGKSAYGLTEVEEAVSRGAAEALLVSDELLKRGSEVSGRVERIINNARTNGTAITIFNSEDDAGKEFKTFKLAVLLRYKLRY